MSEVMGRTLAVLELLATKPEGLSLSSVATQLGIPRSATHRLMTGLCNYGYVRQIREQGDYLLTTRLMSLGLGYLSASGVTDAAQPLLEELASKSEELVRLSVVDGDNLIWIAKAQGADKGLRYDPDMGAIARLSCSASGIAWLSTLSDERALELVEAQGYASPGDYGPNAITCAKDLLTILHQTRIDGFSQVYDAFALGLSTVAAPVWDPSHGRGIGVISIAGPTVRLGKEKVMQVSDALVDTARAMSASIAGSPLLRQAIDEMKDH